MKRKIIWGLGVLIVLLVVAGVFLVRPPDTEPEKRFILPSDEVIKQAQEANKPPRESNKPPGEAKEGYKWVWHHDHWDEVPIAQSDALPQRVTSNDPRAPMIDTPRKGQKMTYEEYEQYLTEAWQNIKRNEFGLPLLPSSGVSPYPLASMHFKFPTESEQRKASLLYNRMGIEEDERMVEAALRQDAYYVEKLRRLNQNDK